MSHTAKKALFVLFLVIPFLGSSATFTSIITGDWDDGATWGNASPGSAGLDYPGAIDNATISTGTNVSLTADETVVNLTITSGGILDALTNNNVITINGNLDVDGTLKADNKDIIFNGGLGITIDGVGTVFMNNNGKKFKVFGAAIILSSADLNLFGKIEIQNNIVVTNNGILTADDDIDGKNGNSEWINASNSIVNVRKKMMNTGKLTADAVGNTVEYYGDNQNVKTPVGSTYYNLNSSGKASKTNTQLADLIITNDFTLIGGTYDCNGFDITIAGDWLNPGGTFLESTANVNFNGVGEQAITTFSVETFNNWELTGGGTVSINTSDVVVSNTMTMTSGNINASAQKITLGTAPGSAGTLAHISGTIIGSFERWLPNTTGVTYLYPLGTSANYNPANITFNTIGNDGSVVGKFVEAGPGNNGLSLVDGATTIYNSFVEGYWDFTVANSFAASDFNLDLTGNGFTAFTIDAATRILARSDEASGWAAEGSHVAAFGNTANRSNITTISGHYCFGDDTNCSAPTTPSITSADAEPCSSTSGTYQVTNTGNTYAWSIYPTSAGTFNPVPSAGDFSVTVDWGAAGQAASVICIETNGCTISEPDTFSINVHSIAPSSITGRTSVAKATLGEPYSVTGLAGYTYTWSITDGSVASGQGSSSITVDWDNSIGIGQVSVVAQSGGGCAAATAFNQSVRRYEVINSNGIGGGDWSTAATWDCNCVPIVTDNVRILSNDVVTQGNYNIDIDNLIIQLNATLERTTNNKDINVFSDLIHDGLITLGAGNKKLKLNGISATISGGGTINITAGGKVEIKTGHKMISSTSMLTVSGGPVDIKDAGIVITNNGSISITNDILHNDGTNNWVNAANSTLNLGGDFDAVGQLTASSNGNTVNYYGAGAQDIVLPVSSIYYNLSFSGSNTKTASNPLDINGDLLIQDIAQFDPVDNDFTLAGNWTDNSAHSDPFLEGIGTVTIDGATEQNLTSISGMESFYNFIMNKNSEKLLLNDVLNIVNGGTMTFTKGIVISSTLNEVQFDDGALATLGNVTSYIDGPVFKIGDDFFTFPLGNAGNYNPLGISSPAQVTDKFQAQYTRTSPLNRGSKEPSIDHVSTLDLWDLDRIVGTSSLYVTLYWNSTNSEITTLSDLIVGHFDGVTSEWKNMGGLAAGGSGAGTVMSTSLMTSFSPLTFASTTVLNPLPIELISFEANLNEDRVDLKWITETEINNDFFTIERSVDGENWDEVIKTDGAGISSQMLYYYETDSKPLEGISYYRLKQTDFNGEFKYSNIVSIKFVPKSLSDGAISVFPNPVFEGETVKILFNDIYEGKIFLVLRDITGRLFYTKTIMNIEDGKLIAIPIDYKIPSGIYIVTATSETKIYNQKLIVR